jgi:hypothetical protein
MCAMTFDITEKARVFATAAHAAMAEQNQGIDWKALSHAVRVANEALEFMATGWITFPLPNAAHILAIKEGVVPYKVVAEEIEDLLARVEEAQSSSVLPAQPDQQYIEDLLFRVYGRAVATAYEGFNEGSEARSMGVYG